MKRFVFESSRMLFIAREGSTPSISQLRQPKHPLSLSIFMSAFLFFPFSIVLFVFMHFNYYRILIICSQIVRLSVNEQDMHVQLRKA